jgi:vitamin B12 transporter
MKLTKGFKGRYFSLAAIAATVSCVQMHAQNTQAIQLEKIVVSAANTEEEEEAVTEDVTVITADEISERGYQTLKDALASVPGITFTSNGGFGQPTNIYLRNFNSDHTLVLIDGIRVNDVTGLSGAQIEQYRLDDVERIEVIEGPQSGIWGADASAGVINIVTKYPRKKSVTFAFKGGNYDTKSLSFAFGDKNGAFDYRFALSHIDTDGFSAAEPGKSSPDYGKRGDDLGWEKDPYKNTTYRLNLGYDVSKNDRLEALMMAVDATVHYDASAGIDAKDLDDPFGFGLSSYVNDIKNRFYNVAYLKKMDAHSAKLFYNFSTFHRTQYGGYTGSVKEAGLQDRFDYMEDGFLAGGAGYQGFHQGLSAGVDLGKKYANRYIYLSDHNALFNGATQFSGAVRYDNYTTFDNKATYKIGIKQKLIDEVFASANYGTGYNVPTLYRLYDSYAGNKNLTPENVNSQGSTAMRRRSSVT